MASTILVIEDEDMVREMLKDDVERGGFHVLVARGGNEALDVCNPLQRDRFGFGRILLMPGTSGTDLAGYLAIRYPAMRTIRMSGFTEACCASRGCAGNSRFCQKPFSRKNLLATVRGA